MHAAHGEEETMTKNIPEALRFIEAGDTFARLSPLDVIVIGGGQAGLSVGYHLKRQGLRFVILDASERVGDVWRKRWDSLRLFSPAWLDGLDGLPFPGPRDAFPTKDQMADYLESYAAHFNLPVQCNTRVQRLWKRGERYVVSTTQGELEAAQVVIAMANYQSPSVPAFARELRSDIVQLHSSAYKNPQQMREGSVLVVGTGNSGAEIAKDLVGKHPVTLAGRDVGQTPHRPDSWWGRWVMNRFVMRVVFHYLLTIRTPLGRKARPALQAAPSPLIRTKRRHLVAAGVQLAQRITGVRNGLPVTEDGKVFDVRNVVWSTGYEHGSSFIDLPIFDDQGEPKHEAGVVTSAPGLYFVGLHFLFSMSSAMVHGVGRDAQRIAQHVAERAASQAQLERGAPAGQVGHIVCPGR
ncbi:MAG TPA: FAD-dependent oxidoreductase [Polyangiales bacterium]|nr:FAD-dependent oxidoreductase [Polyangiales bacterium]